MSDHIRGMTNDIANLEIFGPNPQNNFDFINDHIKKSHEYQTQ